MDDAWERRIAEVWASADGLSDEEVVTSVDALAALHPGEPRAWFEGAGARDFAGREAEAEPLYRRALESGLSEPFCARAVVQLASTLRNLGRTDAAAELLERFLAEHHDHELADAARAFLALCRVDQGAAVEATQLALTALAPHLPRYSGAVRYYASTLTL
ncbi:tetratricopeptide repeat protein [Ruicaihuangia caeni]|uniref:Tetratricopeptide repeat protein n=1 Tax=Ruicaihuangia caeni TaxID=3042517 RepID=A0AAW6T9I0_9MICO|nr:tetratricopeptide repeat protein [Klugiella sp. YN-L-19]MDI2097802.1 tetratricopeptide repeat protein [Klugiella sp. YN-L-19]